MHDLISNLRNRRIAAIAIALVLIAQFAMVTHEVLVEHSPGEHCGICMVHDGFGNALAASVAAALPVVARSSSHNLAAVVFRSAAVSAARNRGPPVL
jgi:hypothetical protein